MFDSFLNEFLISAETPCMVPNQTYAIVERTLVPELMSIVYQKGLTDIKHAPLFDETIYHEYTEQGPILIQLSDKNDSFSKLSCLFSKIPCGCFLQAEQSFDEVLSRLRKRLMAKIDENKAMLRFYEPRMLLPFLGVLSAAEKAEFLGGVSKIHWFHHMWLTYSNLSNNNGNKEEDNYRGLILSKKQLLSMQSIQKCYLEEIR